MDMQKLVDLMNATSMATRSRYQMTLGKLIDVLGSSDPSLLVVYGGADSGAPGDEDSYRGYYSDLSFDASGSDVTVASLKERCEKALGATYQGYKGGDFVMSKDTPIWCAGYGCCGNAIMDAVQRDGAVVLMTKNVEAHQ